MKQTKPFSSLVILTAAVMAVLLACSSKKNTVANRFLQNLSANYNLIYNSNVLLEDFEDRTFQSIKNDYESVLPLYYAPFINFGMEDKEIDKDLKEIDQKARVIIADKELSNYLDDAYILLGKASFYAGNYYTAYEYFDYVTKAYRKETNNYLNALNWKVRSLIQLNEDKKVVDYIDTLKSVIPYTKKFKADAFATIAQINIYKENYTEAISFLEKAQKEKTTHYYHIRWNYVLGQLNEKIKDYTRSLYYYKKVQSSNAAFEMYFNAKLSAIRVNDLKSNGFTDRKKELLTLVKDDKNADFIDKIYYEVAEDFYADTNLTQAIDFYKLSAKKSTANVTQKALSFLKVADINFKELRNYVSAKAYYDSALTLLPKTYPTYESIKKKSDNLNYLKNRYEIISQQDTLQYIAKLPESNREKALDDYFSKIINTNDSIAALDNNDLKDDANTAQKPQGGNTSGNTNFYFNNRVAMGKGYNDFIAKWGNRSLTDNWRQSIKPSVQSNQQEQHANNPATSPLSPDKVLDSASKKQFDVKAYLDSLPVTAEKLEKSNQKIIKAYNEIASFYQQELNDKEEAIKIYEMLEKRFPANPYADVMYYTLYLDYKGTNNQKSEMYKNLVLTKYPSSIYAKIILDPSFSLKQSDLEAALQKNYNALYDAYENKQFADVITAADQTMSRFPGSYLEPQYAYLKSISIGHLKPVDALVSAFNQIVTKYPNDKLIVPLVNQHLAYIKEHLDEFKNRPVALVDFDPSETPFSPKKLTVPSIDIAQEPQKPVLPQADSNTALTKSAVDVKLPTPGASSNTLAVQANSNTSLQVVNIASDTNNAEPEATSATVASSNTIASAVPNNLFSTEVAKVYYTAILVNSTEYGLSSSRFGIGQFNRSRYPNDNLRHYLKELPQDQIIYVGDFKTYNDALYYMLEISQELSKVMKVPPANYSTFIISADNLGKIKNRETIISYQNFIKTNDPQNK